jgi:hypothetical protein
MGLGLQVAWLFVLAIPVAAIAWTVTHEEVFREPREWMLRRADRSPSIWQRKFFYLFTCEYCFSHYVAAFFLWFAHYRLLLPGWRGAIVAFFALVWVANIYMSIFGRLRLEIHKERVEIKEKEQVVEEKKVDVAAKKNTRPAA